MALTPHRCRRCRRHTLSDDRVCRVCREIQSLEERRQASQNVDFARRSLDVVADEGDHGL